MDVFVLQALEALKADPTVITGGKYGTDPYGKFTGVMRYGTLGTPNSPQKTSYNSDVRWKFFIAEMLGGVHNGSSTLGSNAGSFNLAYQGLRLHRPDDLIYFNNKDTGRNQHIINDLYSSSGGQQYGLKGHMFIPVRNTSASDITITLDFVGSAYSSHSGRGVFTLVPDESDNQQVSQVTFTSIFHETTNNVAVYAKDVTFPAGKTTILVHYTSARPTYNQQYEIMSMVNGIGDMQTLVANNSLVPDIEVTGAIMNKIGTPVATADANAAINACASIWNKAHLGTDFEPAA